MLAAFATRVAGQHVIGAFAVLLWHLGAPARRRPEPCVVRPPPPPLPGPPGRPRPAEGGVPQRRGARRVLLPELTEPSRPADHRAEDRAPASSPPHRGRAERPRRGRAERPALLPTVFALTVDTFCITNGLKWLLRAERPALMPSASAPRLCERGLRSSVRAS